MTKHNSRKAALKALADLASEEIMSLSEEELRTRARDEDIDIQANALQFQQALNERIASARRQRLTQAREKLDALHQTPAEYDKTNLSKDALHDRFLEIIASGLMDKDSRLTLAFREGASISETDLRSLIVDYEELLKRNQSEQ